ncbi:hypothetical protein GEMRC1_005800 [Eukaryota sp. GEM-RC1]
MDASQSLEYTKGTSPEDILFKLEQKIDTIDLLLKAEIETTKKLTDSSDIKNRVVSKIQHLKEQRELLKQEHKLILTKLEEEKENLVDDDDSELDEDEFSRKTYRGFRERSSSIHDLGRFTEDVEHSKELEKEIERAERMLSSVPSKPISKRVYGGELGRVRMERGTPSIITRKHPDQSVIEEEAQGIGHLQ